MSNDRSESAIGEDATGFGELRDALSRQRWITSMVGMGGAQQRPEPLLDLPAMDPTGGSGEVTGSELEDAQGPTDRITKSFHWHATARRRRRQRIDQRPVDGAHPADAATNRGHHGHSGVQWQLSDRIDRGQQQLRRCPANVGEVELGLVAAHQPQAAPLQANPVLLKPVAKSRLRNTQSPLDLVSQGNEIGDEIGLDCPDMGSNNTAEQHAAIPGRWIDRKVNAPERDPSSRSDRP